LAGPDGEGFFFFHLSFILFFSYDIEPVVLEECLELCKNSKGTVTIHRDLKAAISDADIIYCDSWMSYGIPLTEATERRHKFLPFQVNEEMLRLAKKDCIFMNCLPASLLNLILFDFLFVYEFAVTSRLQK
jgi:ornithine carbamoyltransferase